MLYGRARSQPMRNRSNIHFSVGPWGKIAALAATCVAFLLVLTSPCFAQQPVILRHIEFVGLKKMTSQQAIDASGLKIGDTINPQVIDAAAEKLMQSGLF